MKKLFSWMLDETTSTDEAGIETTKIVINKKARALGEFAISTLVMALFIVIVAYSFTMFTTICTIGFIIIMLTSYIIDAWKTLRTAFDPTVSGPSVAVTTEKEEANVDDGAVDEDLNGAQPA